MNATTTPVYFDLGDTPTYSRRRAGWFAGARPEHPDDRAGTLRLVLSKRGRSDDATECDEYGVEEERDTDLPAGVRSFLLLSDTDPHQADVYRCTLGTDGRGRVYDSCTCRAGEHRQRCKHICSLTKLLSEKVL